MRVGSGIKAAALETIGGLDLSLLGFQLGNPVQEDSSQLRQIRGIPARVRILLQTMESDAERFYFLANGLPDHRYVRCATLRKSCLAA